MAVVVFPEVLGGEPLRISASTFQAWKRCPGSAEANLRGFYSPDSKPSFAGSLAHRVFNRHLNHGPISDEEFDMACRKEIGDSNLNLKLSEAGLGRISALEPLFEEVRDLYRRFVRLPMEGFVGSEVSMGHEIEASQLTLRGRIDAVFDDGDDSWRLVDWKTGGVHDPDSQLGFYAMLWALERDDLPGAVEAYSVRSGEVYRDEPTREKVEAIMAEVAQMVSSLREVWSHGADAERRAGPWCEWCPILAECAEGQAVTRLLD